MLPEGAFQSLRLSSPHAQHCQHRFTLAGLDVRLHSSVQRLADLFYRPFSHLPVLESDAGGTNLDIEIITGVPRPQLTSAATAGFRRDVGGHRFRASPDGRFVCHEILESESLWCLDRHSGRIMGWVQSPERLTLYERGKPFASLLPLIVERFERYMIHAAMVSWRGRGVLFAGAAGAGKSTSALSCLRGGFDFIGEDLLVLEEKPTDGFVGHGIYNSAWIAPDHLPRFGELSGHAQIASEAEEGKRALMLADIFPDRLRAAAPVHFMMLPRVRPGVASTVMPAGKPEALKQLAPNCLMTASRIDKKGFESLVRLVKTTRCYRLELGDDLECVPQLVREVVERDA